MNTRREFLRVGGLGALGLSLPQLLASDRSGKSAKADSCIIIFLNGGAPHLDMWDMKPNAPEAYRGPYKPISTKVPGMRINEMHTRLAKHTDQFTLINSMTHPGGISNHFDAMHNLLSGQSDRRVQQGR